MRVAKLACTPGLLDATRMLRNCGVSPTHVAGLRGPYLVLSPAAATGRLVRACLVLVAQDVMAVPLQFMQQGAMYLQPVNNTPQGTLLGGLGNQVVGAGGVPQGVPQALPGGQLQLPSHQVMPPQQAPGLSQPGVAPMLMAQLPVMQNGQQIGTQPYVMGQQLAAAPAARVGQLPDVAKEHMYSQALPGRGYHGGFPAHPARGAPGRSGQDKMGANKPVRQRRTKDIPHSKLLDNFRSKSTTHAWTLKDIRDHVVEFSQHQNGSRFIQAMLESPQCPAEDKELVFQEVLPVVIGLSQDLFGNYVVQKLIQHGTDSHRKQIANSLKGQVIALSLQPYGCRVLQKALEFSDANLYQTMTEELQGRVLECVKNQNGNHVIQKCIECLAPNLEFIAGAFAGQVPTLAQHPYGCRVLQHILEYCSEDSLRAIVGPIVDEIIANIQILVKDRYGNYVVQHVLENGSVDDQEQIVEALKFHIPELSVNKFASNVIEKLFCSDICSGEDRLAMAQDITGRTAPNGLPVILSMVRDMYGNYVVQRMVSDTNLEVSGIIIQALIPYLKELRHWSYGKHIAMQIESAVQGGMLLSKAPENSAGEVQQAWVENPAASTPAPGVGFADGSAAPGTDPQANVFLPYSVQPPAASAV
eukprot:gene9557-1718_t